MGDMGDDIGKSLAGGCVVFLLFLAVEVGIEWYLARAFLCRPPITFDGILMFCILTVFFTASIWRLYMWAIDKTV